MKYLVKEVDPELLMRPSMLIKIYHQKKGAPRPPYLIIKFKQSTKFGGSQV